MDPVFFWMRKTQGITFPEFKYLSHQQLCYL